MPDYSTEVKEKLEALRLLTPKERKYAEVCAVYWPAPTGTKVYSTAEYSDLGWWPGLAAAIETEFGEEIPLRVRIIPDGRDPFSDLPRTASVSDDSINLTFSDLDDGFSDLLMLHGEGIRVEKFSYWEATPAEDDPFTLLLSAWRGILHAPKDMNRAQVKVTASAGFRAAAMLVPRRPHAISCPHLFGGLFTTQAEVDFHKGCPHNANLTEGERDGAPRIGVAGIFDCPRRTVDDCFARLTEPDTDTPTKRFWPGFETRPDPIANNQTKGPNLLARAYGNESNLNEPIRMLFGERYVKSLNLLAFRVEEDTNHPEDGFLAALFEVGEGPLLALWEFRINGQLVGAEHQQHRLGELGQLPTGWSPEVNSYSGTSVIWGRIQGDFRGVSAGDISGSVRALGQRDIRVYSDENIYTPGFIRNRMWALLELLANARAGYGQDYVRYNIPSAIETAEWCDEVVTITDPNGNTFSGVRSTFNAEVTARAIQQQVKDICTAGRIGLPFEFNGQDVFVPLKVEDLDDPDIPAFTDEGNSQNIVYDGAKSSLTWSYISDDELTNQWTVNFDDYSNGGVDTQLIFGDQRQQLRAGRAWGDRSKRVINKSQAAFGITNADEAARFGLSLLYLGPLDSGGILNPWKVKFTTWYTSAFKGQNYKPIRVINSKLQAKMAAYFEARGITPFPGCDYTFFRLMKYTRKGNLQVEIEGQMYAYLPEEVAGGGCAHEYTWEVANAEATLCGSRVEKTGGSSFPTISGSFGDGYALSDEAITNEAGQYASFKLIHLGEYVGGIDGVGYIKGLEIIAGLFPAEYDAETLQSEYPQFGFYLEVAGSETLPPLPGSNPDYAYGPFLVAEEEAGVGAYEYVAVGSPGGDWAGYPSFDENSELMLKVEPSGKVGFYLDGSLVYTSEADAPASMRFGILCGNRHPPDGPGIASFNFNGVDAGEGGGAETGFSDPRDFTAVVNSSTGQVQFHWTPPATHPELVTGYTVYEEDGSTVAMPTALAYNFELTLSPGEYTYKLQATDGTNLSGFVSVTFTVPTPPPDTLDLIDRTSGQILVDRATGQLLESRTA